MLRDCHKEIRLVAADPQHRRDLRGEAYQLLPNNVQESLPRSQGAIASMDQPAVAANQLARL
jgi:hypothetical protein